MEQRVLSIVFYACMSSIILTCLASWPHFEWKADWVAAAGQIAAALVAVGIALWSDRSVKKMRIDEREGAIDLLALSLTVPLQLMLQDYTRISHTLHTGVAVNNPDDGIPGDQIAGFIAIDKKFLLKDIQNYLNGADRISQAVLVLSNLIDAYNSDIAVYAKLTPHRLVFQAIKDRHRPRFLTIEIMTKELNDTVSKRIVKRLVDEVPSVK